MPAYRRQRQHRRQRAARRAGRRRNQRQRHPRRSAGQLAARDPGGIREPARCAATVDSGAYGNGSTDASTAIQDAVNHCLLRGRQQRVRVDSGRHLPAQEQDQNRCERRVGAPGGRPEHRAELRGPTDTMAVEMGSPGSATTPTASRAEIPRSTARSASTLPLPQAWTRIHVITADDASGIAVGDVSSSK